MSTYFKWAYQIKMFSCCINLARKKKLLVLFDGTPTVTMFPYQSTELQS